MTIPSFSQLPSYMISVVIRHLSPALRQTQNSWLRTLRGLANGSALLLFAVLCFGGAFRAAGQPPPATHDPITMIRALCRLNPDDPANADHKTDPSISICKLLVARRAAILNDLKDYAESLPKDADGKSPALPSGIEAARKTITRNRDLFASEIAETEARKVLVTVQHELGEMFYPGNYQPKIDVIDRSKSMDGMRDAIMGAPEPAVNRFFTLMIINDPPREFVIQAYLTLDELDCFYLEKFLDEKRPGKYKPYQY